MRDLYDYLQRMPKDELHVHLEGSIRPTTLLDLSKRNRIKLPAKDEQGLSAFYRFWDFAHFIQGYEIITRCLQTEDGYQLIAYEFGEGCAHQNIRYAEATFSMETNQRLTELTMSTWRIKSNNKITGPSGKLVGSPTKRGLILSLVRYFRR